MAHNIGKTERSEMYLKAVYLLGREEPPVTVTKVAEFLGVSLPSASEMLRRLEQQGLVVTGAADGGFGLTANGLRQAQRLVRRMRLAERLLYDVLGLPLPAIYEEACRWEHAMSAEVEARMANLLGYPAVCPHGHPIPEPGQLEPELRGVPLSELRAGDEAVVAAVPEREPELLAYLCSLQLLPQVRVRVDQVAPYDGPLFLHVDGAEKVVGRQAAARVLVEPARNSANALAGGTRPAMADVNAAAG